MSVLSPATIKLIKEYQLAKTESLPKQGASTIHVDEVAMKVAAFYENLRTIVDWKEEHLMRRAAIIRKLKRRFMELEISDAEKANEVAESLVLELIRGGYFPNDRIEEQKIKEVGQIIYKYIIIIKNNPEHRDGKAGLQFYNWLIEVAACEVEETLSPSIREMALIEYMFGSMKQKIKVSDKIYEQKLLTKDDTDIQIYIAVQQALFKFDRPIVSYNLIRYKYPEWERADNAFVWNISQNIVKIFKQIESDLSHPLANKFYALCEKYDTPYLLIGEILANNDPDEIDRPANLENLIKKTYTKRLSSLKARITRAAIYSTLSIFVTKVIALVILEVIIEGALGQKVSPGILLADVLIPTLLMFLIVSTIKKPSKNNLTIVTLETMKIAYESHSTDTYEIKTRKQRGLLMRIVLSLIYACSALITFSVIYYILHYFNFPIVSIIIDIIFIALILFAGTALSKRGQELTMEEEKEGFLAFIADIFFLPVHGLGSWISTTWKQYNAFTAFFNALIDMPFSAFVEFLERWRYFIKERKEEIR